MNQFFRVLLIALQGLALFMPVLVASSRMGAVYQLNNNNPYNGVIVWRIEDDGSLEFVKQVPTGGAGSGPVGALFGIDPLVSQGSITVVDENLFAVNANSNSITYFEINRHDATSLNFIDSAPTFGQFPVSVGGHRRTICAVTGGVGNGIRCWRFSRRGLTLLPWDRLLSKFLVIS